MSEQPLHGNVLFNALLLAYIAPIALLGLIARKLDVLEWLKFRPALGAFALVLALAYVTLETKRVFQGPFMVAWSLSIAESYAYSAVWLLSALALFVAGIRLARQYIRYAGLAVIVLVVLKVFLWDMSSLEGLLPYRQLHRPGPLPCRHRLAVSAILCKKRRRHEALTTTEGGKHDQGSAE